MPLPGHADDCACCLVVNVRAAGSKRTRTDADLETFLPPPADKRAREEPDAPPAQEHYEDEEPEEDEGEEAEEDPEEEANLLHTSLFSCFDEHVSRLDAARVKRVEILSFKSALEDDGGDDVNPDATQDEIDGLGVWLPGDERQGDVNFRTLLKLLTRVDQRGFERCVHARPRLGSRVPRSHRLACLLIRSSQQLDFHTAFMKAAARVIYRTSWATDRPAIMAAHGWETSNSEVLIRRARTVRACCQSNHSPNASFLVRSTPRRFGKTFS